MTLTIGQNQHLSAGVSGSPPVTVTAAPDTSAAEAEERRSACRNDPSPKPPSRHHEVRQTGPGFPLGDAERTS